MGNNNTSAIKEEDNTSEAEKKNQLDLQQDRLKEENQTNPTAKSEYAGTEAAEIVSVDTSELGNEISKEDTHEDGAKEDDQNIPVTSEEKAVLENAVKASHDTTFDLGKDTPPEDVHSDHLKGKIQTVSTDEGKDVEEKATWPASGHKRSVFEDDSLRGDSFAGDAHMEIQMHPTDGDEDVQEKTTGLASDHTRSKHERDSCEGDTSKEDVNVDKHPTAEGTHVQEIASRLALDDEASDSKKGITQEDTHANDKDESASILLGSRRDVPGKSTILGSSDVPVVNLRDTYGQEIPEVRQPEKNSNAESVEEGGEKGEILSSSSLEVAEGYEKQTESCLRKNMLVTYHHHIDSEPTKEEEDTKVSTLDAVDMSTEVELQQSPVVDSNHKELVKVPSESSLSESWPKGNFLDTNSLCSKDDDDVQEGETQTQEKNISSEKSEGREKDELGSSLGDLSEVESGTPSGNKSNGSCSLLTIVNHIADDYLNSLSESVNVTNPLMYDIEENDKVLDEERKMSRSGSRIENSHDHNPGECLQEPLNEFKACFVSTNCMTTVSNGDCSGERNELFTSSVLGITNTDEEVERPKVTENGHHFDQCDNNLNNASDDTITVPEQKHLVVPEAEVVPHIALSTDEDFIEEVGDNYKKKIEEIYEEPEASHATEKGLEGREMLEQCNSYLVPVEHVESFTLQSPDSLLHIYSYQEGREDQTKNLTPTSIEKSSDWKRANDDEAFEKEWEDYSQHVQAPSTSVFSDQQCPNNSIFENGGYYETREATTRFSTESNPDNPTIFSQIQKSPSFNLNLQNGESSEESDQSPLLFQDKCPAGSLSHQTSLHIMDSWPHTEHGHCSLEHEEMPVEEKIVTMERSYTEKSKAPLLCYSKEDDEASLVVSSQEQGNHAGTCKAVKEVTPTSPKPKEKRKSMSSFFTNCMCCAAVAN